MEYYTKAFKAMLKAAEDGGQFLSEVPYRRSVPLLGEKALPGGLDPLGEREAFFIMTDSGVDREGDVILSAGVEVDQFAKYGSILWGHRADEPRFVLGRPAEVIKEESRILVRAAFASEDENPEGARVARMIQGGVVRAMSVGILIREYTEASDRAGFYPLNIIRSELIETSVTPVPVNPRAVLQAAGTSKGSEEAKAVAELFEEVADSQTETEASAEVLGLTADQVKALVHQTMKELLGERTYSVPAQDSDPAVVAMYNLARLAAQ